MTSPQVRHIQIRCGGSMLESDLCMGLRRVFELTGSDWSRRTH